jgi:type I restriction enzyme M protein
VNLLPKTEIPLNRHFYVYQPPRLLQVIEDDIKALQADMDVARR